MSLLEVGDRLTAPGTYKELEPQGWCDGKPLCPDAAEPVCSLFTAVWNGASEPKADEAAARAFGETECSKSSKCAGITVWLPDQPDGMKLRVRLHKADFSKTTANPYTRCFRREVVMTGQTATQSSKLEDHYSYGGGLALNPIKPGTPNPDMTADHCSHTSGFETPWWQTTLPAGATVSSVKLFNRNAAKDRIHNLNVKIDGQLCGTTPATGEPT